MGFARDRRFYEALPLWGQRALGLVPFPILAGSAYRRTVRRGERLERATREEIRACQEKALAGILEFAATEVPAYRRFRASIQRLRPFDALRELPLIDRTFLQDHFEDFLPRSLAGIAHYQTTTGGTSGRQLRLYLDDASHAIEMGFVHRYWGLMGYTWRKRKATFRGVKFPDLPLGVYWQLNPVYNELQFSPFHLSEANLPAYVRRLKEFAPEYLHGYPSAIDLLAQYVLRHGLTRQMPRILAAFLTSEACAPAQRARIERAFGARVFSWYGHTERVIFAGECEKTTVYHQTPDYGLLEIIDENGNACHEDGQRGELVGTGFWNHSLPLIRYRTGDYAAWRAPACACNRCWDRFDNVEGRWKQDMLIGRTGSRISVTALNLHEALFERVARYQYYQDTPGACTLRILPAPGFSEADRQAIRAAYLQKVGPELDFQVQVANELPLTARGKLRMVESKLTPSPNASGLATGEGESAPASRASPSGETRDGQ